MNIIRYVTHKVKSACVIATRLRRQNSASYVHQVLDQLIDIEKIPAARGRLRKLQEADVLLLKLFHGFCERNNFTYMLARGTALGARRHKGFVPWDDDIDVYVFEREYLRVRETLLNEFKGTGFCLYGVDKGRWDDPTLRISHKDCPSLNLDVFYLLECEASAKGIDDKLARLKRIQKKFLFEYRWNTKDHEDKESLDALRIKYDNKARQILCGNCGDVEPMFLPDLTNPIRCFRSEVMIPPMKMMFESGEFFVPRMVEKYLDQQIGDWEHFPKRFDHHGDQFMKFSDEQLERMTIHLQKCVTEGRFL